MLLYSAESKAPQKHPRVPRRDPVSRDGGEEGWLRRRLRRVWGEAHLDTLLVAFEEVGAGVPGAVPFEELLGKPAVEALIVLPLHVSASLPDAVHGDGGGCDGDHGAL